LLTTVFLTFNDWQVETACRKADSADLKIGDTVITKEQLAKRRDGLADEKWDNIGFNIIQYFSNASFEEIYKNGHKKGYDQAVEDLWDCVDALSKIVDTTATFDGNTFVGLQCPTAFAWSEANVALQDLQEKLK